MKAKQVFKIPTRYVLCILLSRPIQNVNRDGIGITLLGREFEDDRNLMHLGSIIATVYLPMLTYIILIFRMKAPASLIGGQGKKASILGVTWHMIIARWYIEIVDSYLGDGSPESNTYLIIIPDSIIPDRLPVDVQKNWMQGWLWDGNKLVRLWRLSWVLQSQLVCDHWSSLKDWTEPHALVFNFNEKLSNIRNADRLLGSCIPWKSEIIRATRISKLCTRSWE